MKNLLQWAVNCRPVRGDVRKRLTTQKKKKKTQCGGVHNTFRRHPAMTGCCTRYSRGTRVCTGNPSRYVFMFCVWTVHVTQSVTQYESVTQYQILSFKKNEAVRKFKQSKSKKNHTHTWALSLSTTLKLCILMYVVWTWQRAALPTNVDRTQRCYLSNCSCLGLR